MYLSLHIPGPFGAVLRAASELHRDSRDSLFSEQNRFRLSILCLMLMLSRSHEIRTSLAFISYHSREIFRAIRDATCREDAIGDAYTRC